MLFYQLIKGFNLIIFAEYDIDSVQTSSESAVENPMKIWNKIHSNDEQLVNVFLSLIYQNLIRISISIMG